MKRIKGVRKTTHKLILSATKDYYGQYDKSIKRVASYLCGEKIDLSLEELSDTRKIRNNLLDEIYCKNLI